MSTGVDGVDDAQIRGLLVAGWSPEAIADRFGRLSGLDRVDVLLVRSRAGELLDEFWSAGEVCGDVTGAEVGGGFGCGNCSN